MKKSISKILFLALLAQTYMLAPLQAQEPLKVGFVYIATVGDTGWTTQHERGRQEMIKNLGDRVETSIVERVAEGPDAQRVIREMASSGNQLIFAPSFGYMNQVEKVASMFPKVMFAHGTGYKSNGRNFFNYNARFYEGRYVNGVVAGAMTKSNLLGYVAAFPIPEVVMGINAFTRGALSVNKNAKVRVIWVNSWFDPGKERAAALTLISQGVDVITHHSESTATVQAAEEKKIYAFGYHSDMSKYAPNAQLSATIHEWGGYYTKIAEAMLNNSFKPYNVWGGYKEGMIRTAPLNKVVPADVRKNAERIESEMRAGKFHPFTGPVVDQSGKVQIPAGKTISDEELNQMSYYVQGVDSEFPKN